jgi:hypothetical protein
MNPTIFCVSREVGMGEWLGINLDDPILLSYDSISLLFTSIRIADVKYYNKFMYFPQGGTIPPWVCI